MPEEFVFASPGLIFLFSTFAAMPPDHSDETGLAALDAAMRLAIRNRFEFCVEDLAAMQRLSIETSAGDFSTLDPAYYLFACECGGGPYARLWEYLHGHTPWSAARAVYVADTRFGVRGTFKEDGPVAPGAAVLMPTAFSETDFELASCEDYQVWWCTALTDEHITLARYALPKWALKRRRSQGLERGDAPARVRTLSREEWACWNELAKGERAPVLA